MIHKRNHPDVCRGARNLLQRLFRCRFVINHAVAAREFQVANPVVAVKSLIQSVQCCWRNDIAAHLNIGSLFVFSVDIPRQCVNRRETKYFPKYFAMRQSARRKPFARFDLARHTAAHYFDPRGQIVRCVISSAVTGTHPDRSHCIPAATFAHSMDCCHDWPSAR